MWYEAYKDSERLYQGLMEDDLENLLLGIDCSDEQEVTVFFSKSVGGKQQADNRTV